jgi:hypothetical protein
VFCACCKGKSKIGRDLCNSVFYRLLCCFAEIEMHKKKFVIFWVRAASQLGERNGTWGKKRNAKENLPKNVIVINDFKILSKNRVCVP